MPDPDPEPDIETGAVHPLDDLQAMAMQAVPVDDGLEHVELYTPKGLLTLLWHGSREAEAFVVCVGGAMGGLLGPDGGVYHRLGRSLAERGLGVIRVSYRCPNDLDLCVTDTLAAVELAFRHGGRRFVTVGHSFGGAVAVRAAAHAEPARAPGVVTLATQTAGCEPISEMGDRRFLFIHGTADQILPHQASELVRYLAGTGELVLLDGADHLLAPAGAEVTERLVAWLPETLAVPDDPAPTSD
ncbi:MAG: alpha/beta hydrolase [Acidimicrobiales bacterium]